MAGFEEGAAESVNERQAAARLSLKARGIAFTPEELLQRIESGDVDAVRFFLEAGMPADTPVSEHGDVALNAAVRFDQGEIVTLLLRAGASAEVRNSVGYSPLMAALWARHVAALEALLAGGVPVDERNDKGQTALMVAASDGRVGSVTPLLKHGAAVDLADEEGTTALMHAAKNGRMLAAEALLLGGADHALRDKAGLTATDLAVRGGFADVARLLARAERGELKRGAAPRSRPWHRHEPATAGLPSRLWALAWVLAATAGLLTLLNVTGASPWGVKLPPRLNPSAGDAAEIALRFAVEEVEAYREAHGRLPRSVDDLGLGNTVSWAYAPQGDQMHYTLSATVRGKQATFNSAFQTPASIGAGMPSPRGGPR